MSEGFEVDLDEMRAVAARLETLGSEIGICRAGGEGGYGLDVLADAARDFRIRWSGQLDSLRDDLTESSMRVRQTAKAYELIDHQAAERICRMLDR